jgi:hypothetical protein
MREKSSFQPRAIGSSCHDRPRSLEQTEVRRFDRDQWSRVWPALPCRSLCARKLDVKWPRPAIPKAPVQSPYKDKKDVMAVTE